MKQAFTLLFLAFALGIFAQTVADFENFNLGPDSYDNNGNGQGFTSGNITLPNTFTDDGGYESWSGWAISNTTDTQTAGFSNQYSAITGSGQGGSATYATTYFGGVVNLEAGAIGGIVEGLHITNNTYSTLSMENGDSFAKIFGGETGDDPDYFLLTIQRYINGVLDQNKVIEFYLADYRFADNSQDYIVKDWEWVDLTSLGNVDSLYFSLSSTDNHPKFGMNTPAYFCIDNLTTTDIVGTKDRNETLAFDIFPNPTQGQFILDWPINEAGTASIFDLKGTKIQQFQIKAGVNNIAMTNLSAGIYVLQVATKDGFYAKRFVKK